MRKIASVIVFFIVIIQLRQAGAELLSYRTGETVLGELGTYTVKARESLIEIARRFDLGYNEIADMNPTLDVFVPGKGTPVEIPTAWILPEGLSHGSLVINLAELRLYYNYVVAGKSYVLTFPIGIGSEGNATPLGEYDIIEKIEHPAWYVPESIKKEKPFLPDVVPAGPLNPLGSHAMRLSLPTILIHGTDKPWGVGRRISHGCIRLYPEDIPRLFKVVPNGTKVLIVRQPIKAGIKNGRVYVEVHRVDFAHDVDYFEEAVQLLTKKDLIGLTDTKKLYDAVEEKKGVPVDVSDRTDCNVIL